MSLSVKKRNQNGAGPGSNGHSDSNPAAKPHEAPVGRLVSRYEADEYLTLNPFIINYYRNRYSVNKSIHSLCELHNETGNIMCVPQPLWSMFFAPSCELNTNLCSKNVSTHFLPFLGLFILGIYAWQEHPFLFPVGVSFVDKWMLVGTIAFCAICFFNSTIYHTFMSHSEKAYGYLLRLDYCGINGVIVACTVGGVYFGYDSIRHPTFLS